METARIVSDDKLSATAWKGTYLYGGVFAKTSHYEIVFQKKDSKIRFFRFKHFGGPELWDDPIDNGFSLKTRSPVPFMERCLS